MQVIVHGDLSGQYKIEGLDFWNSFGYFVESGGNELLQLYKSKEVYSKDWKGQNGKQYDLTKRFFDDKIVTLSGYLVANDEGDFWQKYLAFWNLLKSQGAKLLYSHRVKQTFSVFYLDSPNSKLFTELQDHPGKIAMQLDLQLQVMFMEMEPPSSVPQPPIVNAGGNKVITLPTNQLIITGASATPKGNASITSLLWEFLGSGLIPIITPNNTLNPVISNLNTAGVYPFKLTAIDSNEKQASSLMSITVNAENSNNAFDYTFSYNLS